MPEIDFPAGQCHFVATPIGNLGDISLRALAVLAAADVVYAEDTRHTRRLLNRYGIEVPLSSYHDHNKAQVVPIIVSRLMDGDKVAVVSDAGMPCISDPGFTLVQGPAGRRICLDGDPRPLEHGDGAGPGGVLHLTDSSIWDTLPGKRVRGRTSWKTL